jgi:hypothetical protein
LLRSFFFIIQLKLTAKHCWNSEWTWLIHVTFQIRFGYSLAFSYLLLSCVWILDVIWYNYKHQVVELHVYNKRCLWKGWYCNADTFILLLPCSDVIAEMLLYSHCLLVSIQVTRTNDHIDMEAKNADELGS